MKHQERHDLIDSIYRDLLWRDSGPVDRKRFCKTDLILSTRVTWRLKRDREYREFIRPLLALLTSNCRSARGRDPRAEEARCLVDRFRLQYPTLDGQIGAVDHAQTFAKTTHKTFAEARETVSRLFLELLGRPPDAGTVAACGICLLLDLLSEAELRQELLASPEYRSVVHPLKEELKRIHTIHFSRPPTPSETDRILILFRARFVTLELQREAVRGQSPVDTTSAALAHADDTITRLFRELLGRPADHLSHQFYCASILLGLVTEREIRREILDCPEHCSVIRPLRNEIDRIFSTFLIRSASPSESQDAIDRFRTHFITLEEQRDAIRNGEARIHLGIRPLKLEMDITSQCNLRCTMCYLSTKRFATRERFDMSISDLEHIADQVFPYCSHLSFSIGTEPLLHPDFCAMLGIARRYGVPWIYVSTNGLLLDDHRIEQIVQGGLHGFSISIDAATAETYESIRVGGSFERLLSNIRALNAAKERLESDFPVITFNFVLMRSNIHELPGLVELARDLRIQGIVAMHLMPFEGLDLERESLAGEPGLCNSVIKETRELASRYGIDVSFPEQFEVKSQDPQGLKDSTPTGFALNVDLAPVSSQCKFPWVFVGLDPYGNVVPCGYWFRDPPMGNVVTEDFESVWRNRAYEQLRLEHLEGRLRPTCRTCPAAGMGSVNAQSSFREVRLGDSPVPGGFIEKLVERDQSLRLAGWILFRDGAPSEVEIEAPSGKRFAARPWHRPDLAGSRPLLPMSELVGFSVSLPVSDLPADRCTLLLRARRGKSRLSCKIECVRKMCWRGQAPLESGSVVRS